MKKHFILLSLLPFISFLLFKINNPEVDENGRSSQNQYQRFRNSCIYTWTSNSSGASENFKSVSAVSELVGWVGGFGPKVVKTTNGGINWTNATGSGLIGNIYNIYAWNANEALCASIIDTAFIFKTTNGGTTWTKVFSQPGGFINAIQMVSSTDGYAVGDPVGGKWTVLKTTNGGVNWARMATEPTQAGSEFGYNNSFQIKGSIMWFGTNNTRIYRSSNLGLNWSSSATTGTTSTLALNFNDTLNGLSAGSATVKSTNGGISFSTVSSPGISGNINGLEGLNSDWWAIRSDSSVYRSTNHGTNWSTEYSRTGAVFQDLDFVEYNGCNVGWAVGNSGVISKLASGLTADYEVTDLYAFGKVPENFGFPDSVCISVKKKQDFDDTIKICLKIENSDNTVKHEEIITIPSLQANDTTVCTDLPNINGPKTDRIIVNALIENADKVVSCDYDENSKSYCRTVTKDRYSYIDSCKNFDGGFGFSGRVANYVAAFRNKSLTDTFKISSADLSFFDTLGSGNKSYRVVIYDDNGTGKPGTRLYLSSALTSPAGTNAPVNVTHLINPVVRISPNKRFYVGYRQTTSSNLKVSFQNEAPVRTKAFFFTSPDTGSTWYDFSDSSKNVRFEVTPRTGSRLELNAFIEGFYDNVSNIMVADTCKAILRNGTSPYAGVDSVKSLILASGAGHFTFYNAANSTPYYIVIKHRNSIETWSGSTNSFSGNFLAYNFSASASQAFGSNMISIDNSPVRFGIFGGDVNQDAAVDGADLALIDNDASNFVVGYVVTDVTGDNIVDGSDFALADNNAYNFVGRVRP